MGLVFGAMLPTVWLTPGCAAPSRQPAVPEPLVDRAAVPGMPHVRTWADEASNEFLHELQPIIARSIERWRAAGHTGPIPTSFLAISGGGANGAFGADLLCGWTDAGTRPRFDVVTGISTGTLTAPFAFLVPAYDDTLRDAYTHTTTNDILKVRALLEGLLSDALADNAPLWQLLKKHVNQDVLRAIAAEYEKGRILLIGTTNLDAQRGVMWNMGAIAARDTPEALELFRRIMLASAAIPAAFPPVMVDVEADGEAFQEMHVDGGAVAQVFLYPSSYRPPAGKDAVERDRRVYVIRNSRLDPRWAQVKRQTLSIAARAIDSLIQNQGVGDLYEIYVLAQRDRIDFNLAFIPEVFKEKPKEEFDPVYMQKLFDIGHDAALNGSPWSKTPPGDAEAAEMSPLQREQ
jgi:hypothetical protein